LIRDREKQSFFSIPNDGVFNVDYLKINGTLFELYGVDGLKKSGGNFLDTIFIFSMLLFLNL
jgi:hypothetical protein